MHTNVCSAKETEAKLKYPFPDIWEHDVDGHLPFVALKIVVQNLVCVPDYHVLNVEKQV